MTFTVANAYPQTGKWNGTQLRPGETLEMADLCRAFTIPNKPVCYSCHKRIKDGAEIIIVMAWKPEDRQLWHEPCWRNAPWNTGDWE